MYAKHLILVKTLGKWYKSVDGRPGFTTEAFDALKFKATQTNLPIHCCIVFDEMKIETKVEKTYGYVDYGGSVDSDCREKCTDALVFLVVPLHAIELCFEAGLVVKAVTFDGCPVNIAMAKKLGCDLNPNNLKTVFKVQNNEIAIFLDPAHMTKLVRNSFEHYREFKDAEGNNIKWNHIEMLHQLQEDEKFHAANKLRSKHLFF
ncbi:unnamed protein product [Arctia plantaginis]|uniref:THAP domain-containing protein 9 n=1 Tax=Arctia plantaginis TaxID=874455 RepID=A0A8S1AYQ6_ARCPL|nr:unnamed protein product [Arctia plantaginis]